MVKKRLLTVLLILLPAFTAPWILAQDEDVQEDETVDISLEEETDTETAEDETSDDDFVPSTQISEDLSVSFPVNI